MIYGFAHTLHTDVRTLVAWVTRRDNGNPDDILQRVADAFVRVLATFGMAFGIGTGWSILHSLILLPFKITLHAAFAVGIYAIFHDLFVMSQNNTAEAQQLNEQKLLGAFRNIRGYHNNDAEEWTSGTLLQPAWMILYARA